MKILSRCPKKLYTWYHPGFIMTDTRKYHLLNCFIAAVWLINGLFCKVLNLVPRHQDIVARILGDGHARLLTLLIGYSEIAMAVWILSGIWKRVNVITQILVILTMNIFEFILVPDLLLWGKGNAVFALLFILLIYYNEYHLNKKIALQT
ncbi:DoxX-like family protein [Chitinophagaceae bacterium LB-8]|uniref:DoxX-like family protein n=1 Tax=Paraflavisolibacter caeni TaxID=2982496 RepID=A0A9X2XSZ5_9BACT|nr:DoxX-like family protein [Paraflavisolibacter caeni]MCU7548599.1 DoxX-like family protein [Paraflavisolibacter caeni]